MGFNSKDIDSFLVKCSWIGLLSLYYSKLMFDKKAAFTKQDLEKIRSGEYVYGYLIACSAFSLLSITSNGNILNITHFDEYLSEKIYDRLVTVADNKDKENANFNWKADIARIQNLSNTIATIG